MNTRSGASQFGRWSARASAPAALLLGAAAASMVALGGCARNKAAGGPFADVADRERERPTLAADEVRKPAGEQPGEKYAGAPVTPDNPPKTVEGMPATVPSRPAAAVGGGAAADPLVTPPPPRAGAPSSIVLVAEDGGILRRDWPVAVFARASGDVQAFPTYWPTLEKDFNRNEYRNLYMEPAEFLWNTLLLPYRAIRTSPGTKVVYSPVGEP